MAALMPVGGKVRLPTIRIFTVETRLYRVSGLSYFIGRTIPPEKGRRWERRAR
uniref:Uncharacterized protein n=1 Tax=Candidatus Kentrum sp. DK TaxID=2126562 RepID=A0A450SH34_9GAMM|nr:MAG: hypothetical protein BECKDK2373C_GA0170839_103622 [Candidatus Kentron sp. DK]